MKFLVILFSMFGALGGAGATLQPDFSNLPPRSLPAGPPLRPAVPWVQADLRIAHLPPADWRQIDTFLQLGYQVIAVNTLAQWDRVGPRAADYPAEIVQAADAYLRRFVDRVHAAGAKAVFYLGPVQSPLHSEVFRQRHPDWLRVNEDGARAPDFINFRDPAVVTWLSEQLAFLAKEYGADGFWFDGYSPVHLCGTIRPTPCSSNLSMPSPKA